MGFPACTFPKKVLKFQYCGYFVYFTAPFAFNINPSRYMHQSLEIGVAKSALPELQLLDASQLPKILNQMTEFLYQQVIQFNRGQYWVSHLIQMFWRGGAFKG